MARVRLPWFKFHYRDWLMDNNVRSMTYQEKGLYIEMLSMQWENHGLPADEGKLWELFRQPGLRRVSARKIFSLFPVDESGLRHNKAAKAAYQKALRQYEEQKERAKRYLNNAKAADDSASSSSVFSSSSLKGGFRGDSNEPPIRVPTKENATVYGRLLGPDFYLGAGKALEYADRMSMADLDAWKEHEKSAGTKLMMFWMGRVNRPAEIPEPVNGKSKHEQGMDRLMKLIEDRHNGHALEH